MRSTASLAVLTPATASVLRAVRRTVEAAHAARIPVGMCGEAAADPRMIPLLLAFGLDEFSVSAPAVPAVRASIARWKRADAEALARRALEADSAAGVKQALDDSLGERA